MGIFQVRRRRLLYLFTCILPLFIQEEEYYGQSGSCIILYNITILRWKNILLKSVNDDKKVMKMQFEKENAKRTKENCLGFFKHSNFAHMFLLHCMYYRGNYPVTWKVVNKTYCLIICFQEGYTPRMAKLTNM